MSLSSHVPMKGTTYSVVCPVCCSPMDFQCVSERMYGTRCTICHSMIDLRNPNEVLAEEDSGMYEGNAPLRETLRYSGDVGLSVGMTASVQLNQIVSSVEQEKRKTIPVHMSSETRQAFSAERNQAIAEKFSFFFPVTHAIEYILFGNRPYAKVGHVRIFRKRIPFFGYVNFCAPRTTTSYAAPCTFTFFSFLLFLWFCGHVQLEWMAFWYYVEWVLVVLFYSLLFRLAYSDPGYVRPAYLKDGVDPGEGVDHQDGTTPATTAGAAGMNLHEIERNQRESLWETVDGVPMERKWCSTCHMHRPIRAAHCYLCGLCCYDHDHHCSVVGVCVGQRKVEMFAMFVTVSSLACILPAAMVIAVLWSHSDMIATAPQMAACLSLAVPLTIAGTALFFTAISMWLSIFQEESTRERIQHVYAQKRNPFNRGCLKNLFYHLIQRRVAPSLFDDAFVKSCALCTEERPLGTGPTITCI